MLKSFFERPIDEQLSITAIMRFDVDKFKPLNNYLKLKKEPSKTIKTAYKNVLLLAWLIKFNKHSATQVVPSVANMDSPTVIQEDPATALPLVERFPAYLDEIFTPAPNPNRFPRIAFKQIVVEYPSGVRITVGECELSHISQLVQLA